MSLFAQCSNIFIYLFLSLIFSQTWLRYKSEIGLSVSSVCRLWRACTCTLLVGFNFSGIFLHHIVAWPSGKLTHQNHKDRLRGSSPTGVLNARGRKKLQFPTAIARKRLKIDIDGYRMLLCVWPALNPFSIHATFTAIIPWAYLGEAKMCKKSRLAISSPGDFIVICQSISETSYGWVVELSTPTDQLASHTVGSRRCRCHL